MDFEEAIEKHPAKEKRLKAMKKRAKNAEILLDLKNHQGVTDLLIELEARVEKINYTLLNKRISAEERDLLFVERDCWNFFIGKFGHAELTIVNIKKYLEKL